MDPIIKKYLDHNGHKYTEEIALAIDIQQIPLDVAMEIAKLPTLLQTNIVEELGSILHAAKMRELVSTILAGR